MDVSNNTTLFGKSAHLQFPLQNNKTYNIWMLFFGAYQLNSGIPVLFL